MSKSTSKRNASHSRIDRFTQMSKQEEIIAEKKRLIEAKLKMMESQTKTESKKETSKKSEILLKPTVQNTFSNDGSFLEKFKQISCPNSSASKVYDEKSDKQNRSNRNESSNDSYQRSNSRWNNNKKEEQNFRDYTRDFSYHAQPTQHNHSYDSNYTPRNQIYQSDFNSGSHRNSNFDRNLNMSSQNFQNDSFMNRDVSFAPCNNTFGNNSVNNWNNQRTETNYNANMQCNNQIVVPPSSIPCLTTMNIPRPSCMPIPNTANMQVPPPTIQQNLSIPPPNTLSLQSIPEPKPLETMSIPRPGPLNLHTIPPPMPMCLNQIPKPKDLDVRNIPPPKQFNIAGIEMPITTYPQESTFYGKPSQVLSTDVPMSQSQGPNQQMKQQSPECNPIERVAKLVVEIGDGYEETFKQKHQHEPEFWFLFHQDSAEYSEYRQLVKKLKEEAYSPEELYEPEFSLNDYEDENGEHAFQHIKQEEDSKEWNKKSLVSSYYDDVPDAGNSTDKYTSVKVEKIDPDESEENKRKRKRKSRWGNDQDVKPIIAAPGVVQISNLGGPAIALPPNVAPLNVPVPPMLINKVTRTDKALLQYAKNTFGTTNLSEEDWVKAEDHFKINLLYQEMLRKRKELDQLSRSGKHKYEYDSDEEVEGGTWEHKLRSQEMEATQKWADELTRKSEGKHHIGDFLPPEELKKFMEKYSAAKNGREPDISDYKEYKLNENNVGFQMLQKLGWKDGEGLGTTGSGIVEPINKASNRESNQGLGLDRPDNIHTEDNEYDAYRKRMMLAYRFRPNPLNNPRRPYY